ncbi:MAG: hypothetical protein K0U15_05795, partial [Proteobacteria bacterium]|nr:hypothetical protein [Pseudomonadota bacterium]
TARNPDGFPWWSSWLVSWCPSFGKVTSIMNSFLMRKNAILPQSWGELVEFYPQVSCSGSA